MALMTQEEFEILGKRIQEGDVDHDTLVDILMAGFEATGIPETREKVMAEVRAKYPTRQDVVAHMRAMLVGYVEAVIGAHGATRQ
jgi:hypothetical protein